MFGKSKKTESQSSAFEKPKESLPDPALKWGITPSKPYDPNEKPGPDHPVHQIPLEKQEKMRKKGINPVLKAEIYQAQKGEGGFWSKVAQTSFGGGWIK
ncbi:uncharacterized protein N7479_010502 [Penicillium vulpinum]|uniref:uncharacterized protein n=1 Tax=Penicillium vulpinum TaxID=29845 RepID=UPI0025476C38|nr:uncharacterized protein N7479_010502 [Penicillium vulpinum]KAJ5952089.1 hypothetical protein N7479_010502 [Penicillium vulpinum]